MDAVHSRIHNDADGNSNACNGAVVAHELFDTPSKSGVSERREQSATDGIRMNEDGKIATHWIEALR